VVGAQVQAGLVAFEVGRPGADQIVGSDVGGRLPGKAAEVGRDPIREVAAGKLPVLRIDGAIDCIGDADDGALVGDCSPVRGLRSSDIRRGQRQTCREGHMFQGIHVSSPRSISPSPMC
jgi:hypothetical protein